MTETSDASSRGRLQVGQQAPDFRLMAAHAGEMMESSLQTLLKGNRGVVLTTYVLDFTGG